MVDRCICFSKTFSELKTLAAQHRIRDVAALQTVTEFGRRCGLCKSYVQRMLDTGSTIFPVMAVPLHPFENPELFTELPGDSRRD